MVDPKAEEAIHIRLPDPNNIFRVNGIKITEAWMPTIKQHRIADWYHNGTPQTAEGAAYNLNSEVETFPSLKQPI